MPLIVPKIIFDIEFNPSLLFFEKIFQIGNNLDLPNWETNGRSLRLLNDKNKFASRIDVKGIITAGEELKISSDFDSFKKYSSKVANEYFNELVLLCQEKLYNKTLTEVFVETYKDLGIAIVFEDKKFNFHLQSGPVRKEEIFKRIQFEFGEPELLPDISLFFNLDCYQFNIKTSEVETFLTSAYENSKKIIQDFVKFILEK